MSNVWTPNFKFIAKRFVFTIIFVFAGQFGTKALGAAELDLSKFDDANLPFNLFGTVIYDQTREEFPCKLNSDSPIKIFDLLLKWSLGADTRTEKLLKKGFIQDICNSRYIPLGHNEFLVLYRGLGVVQGDYGKYKRLYTPWVDSDSLLKLKKVSSNTYITLYEAVTLSGENEDHSYYLIIFSETKGQRISVQFAGLSPPSKIIFKKSGEQECTPGAEGYIENGMSGSMTNPNIDIDLKNATSTISFDFTSMNCKTNAAQVSQQRFNYRDGKIADKFGKLVQIQKLNI